MVLVTASPSGKTEGYCWKKVLSPVSADSSQCWVQSVLSPVSTESSQCWSQWVLNPVSAELSWVPNSKRTYSICSVNSLIDSLVSPLPRETLLKLRRDCYILQWALKTSPPPTSGWYNVILMIYIYILYIYIIFQHDIPYLQLHQNHINWAVTLSGSAAGERIYTS